MPEGYKLDWDSEQRIFRYFNVETPLESLPCDQITEYEVELPDCDPVDQIIF